MIIPLLGIRLIDRDDFQEIRIHVGHLNMQRSPGLRESEQQAAWGIFVIRVVLDDSGMLSGLPNFEFADVPFDGSLEGMLAELKRPLSQASSDLV